MLPTATSIQKGRHSSDQREDIKPVIPINQEVRLALTTPIIPNATNLPALIFGSKLEKPQGFFTSNDFQLHSETQTKKTPYPLTEKQLRKKEKHKNTFCKWLNGRNFYRNYFSPK